MFDPHQTYFGLASKVGGFLVGAGFETVNGSLYRLDAPRIRWDFTQLNVNLGLGLGGGLSFAVVFVFHCPVIMTLNRKNVGKGSWSLDVSVGERWGDLLKVLKSARYAPLFARLARYGIKGMNDDVLTIANLSKDVYGAVGAASSDGEQFISIAIPGFGAGLQLSGSYCIEGRLELDPTPRILSPASGGSGGYGGGYEGHGNG